MVRTKPPRLTVIFFLSAAGGKRRSAAKACGDKGGLASAGGRERVLSPSFLCLSKKAGPGFKGREAPLRKLVVISQNKNRPDFSDRYISYIPIAFAIRSRAILKAARRKSVLSAWDFS